MAGTHARRCALALAVALSLALAPVSSARPGGTASYIVVLEHGVVDPAAIAREHGKRPGVEVEFIYMSGTSFATPNVVGIAARAWSADPGATAKAIVRRVKSQTTRGAVSGIPPNTANKLSFWSPANRALLPARVGPISDCRRRAYSWSCGVRGGGETLWGRLSWGSLPTDWTF